VSWHTSSSLSDGISSWKAARLRLGVSVRTVSHRKIFRSIRGWWYRWLLVDSSPSIPRRYSGLHCDSHGHRFFLAGLPGQHTWQCWHITCIIGCITWPDPGLAAALARMQILYPVTPGLCPGTRAGIRGAPRPPPGMEPPPFTIGIRPEFRGQFWGNRVESPPGRWGKLEWPHNESVAWCIS
jgi:hypothetical protein